MKKTTGYKYQIEQELNKNNWEIVEISSGNNWWDEEHWFVESTIDKNLTLYICFIVDPQSEGSGKAGEKIYEIRASKEFPDNWNDNKTSISSISMTTRKLKKRLDVFIDDLREYERTKFGYYSDTNCNEPISKVKLNKSYD